MANGLTMTCLVEDTNPTTVNLTGNKNILIRHYSTAKASIYAPDGSALDLDMSYVKNGGKTVWGVEGTFPNVVSNVFDFAAMDSELRTATETVEVPMVEYMKLTCHAIESRPDASGDMTLQCVGDYFNGSFGAYSNTLSVKCRHRRKGGSWSGYTTMIVNCLDNAYSAYANLSGLDYKASYDFEIEASDRLSTASSSSLNVVSKPIFHWGESDVAFEVPVSFNAGVESLPVGSAGTISDTNGTLAVDAFVINLNGSVYNNGNLVLSPEYGMWTPVLYGIHPDYRDYNPCFGNYIEQFGWYSKCGNAVTVGFRIKFDCLDTSNDNYIIAISMENLPYKPSVAASGGGMCSGALMVASQNFQCFVAETDGYITTRTQACDYTSGSILTTSKDGCRYTYSADTLTLSGTITYMTA